MIKFIKRIFKKKKKETSFERIYKEISKEMAHQRIMFGKEMMTINKSVSRKDYYDFMHELESIRVFSFGEQKINMTGSMIIHSEYGTIYLNLSVDDKKQ